MSGEKGVWAERTLSDPLEMVQVVEREAATGCVLEPGVRLGQ